jgi:hypothetical protein
MSHKEVNGRQSRGFMAWCISISPYTHDKKCYKLKAEGIELHNTTFTESGKYLNKKPFRKLNLENNIEIVECGLNCQWKDLLLAEVNLCCNTIQSVHCK